MITKFRNLPGTQQKLPFLLRFQSFFPKVRQFCSAHKRVLAVEALSDCRAAMLVEKDHKTICFYFNERRSQLSQRQQTFEQKKLLLNGRVRERYSKVTAGDDIAIEIVLQIGQESQESSARKRSSLGTLSSKKSSIEKSQVFQKQNMF